MVVSSIHTRVHANSKASSPDVELYMGENRRFPLCRVLNEG